MNETILMIKTNLVEQMNRVADEFDLQTWLPPYS